MRQNQPGYLAVNENAKAENLVQQFILHAMNASEIKPIALYILQEKVIMPHIYKEVKAMVEKGTLLALHATIENRK